MRTPANLDLPWREVEYCVVDIETTGLDLDRDELIAFGGVLVKSGRLCLNTRTYFTVKPLRPIAKEAVSVHGLRDQDLTSAPWMSDAVDRVIEGIEGRVLVAHAAWIERTFLRRALKAAGRRFDPPTIDTAALLRALNLAPRGSGFEPAIESAARNLGICVHTPHHALGDALTTGETFLALASRLEGTQPALSAAELVELSRLYAFT